jgi:hypothetical protein
MSMARTITGIIILAIIAIPSYFVWNYYIMPDTSATILCDQGNFEITFPAQPKESVNSIQTFEGPVKSIAYSVIYRGLELSITFEDYPSQIAVIRELPVPQALAGQSANYKLVQRTFDFHGHQLFQAKTWAFGRGTDYTRELVIKNRRYYLTAFTRSDADYPKEIINNFFDSFTLLDTQKQP